MPALFSLSLSAFYPQSLARGLAIVLGSRACSRRTTPTRQADLVSTTPNLSSNSGIRWLSASQATCTLSHLLLTHHRHLQELEEHWILWILAERLLEEDSRLGPSTKTVEDFDSLQNRVTIGTLALWPIRKCEAKSFPLRSGRSTVAPSC